MSHAAPGSPSSAPHVPHAFRRSPVHTRRVPAHSHDPPHEPQGSPGTSTSVSHPPHALTPTSSPSHTTASAPSQTQAPPPHVPHGSPGFAGSASVPLQSLRPGRTQFTELYPTQRVIAAPRGERERELIAWSQAPAARQAHPREEHLLPLMVIAGAAGDDAATVPYHDTLLGLRLAAFHFG